jgi:virginiamycin B lyase
MPSSAPFSSGLLVIMLATAIAAAVPAAAQTGSVVEYAVPTANSQPVSIVSGPDGNLWFTEFRGNKIARMTTNGRVTEFSIPTANSQPDDMDVSPDGNLWFAEVLGNRIGRITPAGVITEFLVPTPNSRPATGAISEFPLPNANSQPWEITAGPDGNVWFTECSGNRIGRIAPDGVISEFSVPTPASQPNTIRRGPDLNPDDNCAYQQEHLGDAAFTERYGSFGQCVAKLATTKTLWFTETAANRIAQITTDGHIFEYLIPTSASQPIGITHGPDRAVWFAEFAANKIGRLDVKTVGKPITPGVGAPEHADRDFVAWLEPVADSNDVIDRVRLIH